MLTLSNVLALSFHWNGLYTCTVLYFSIQVFWYLPSCSGGWMRHVFWGFFSCWASDNTFHAQITSNAGDHLSRSWIWLRLKEEEDLYILQGQYHDCWRPGTARSQGISNCGTDLLLLEYSSLSIRKINTLRLRQMDAIFQWIFLNENVWISIKISLNFVPMSTINNIPALVQIMAWCRPSNKPLSEPMMFSLLMHIRHSASMS